MDAKYMIFDNGRHIGDVIYRGNEDKLPKKSRVEKEDLSKFLKRITKGQCALKCFNIYNNDYEISRMIQKQNEVWR